jgi:hypothetical protein
MDPLLRRAMERREREAAEQRELEDQRPRCEICEGALCVGVRKCRKTGRTDTETRCVDCLDIQEVKRLRTPTTSSDEIFFTENEVERYVSRQSKNPGGEEDWELYQELMAKEEDQPEPVPPSVLDDPREPSSSSDGS